MSDAGKMDRHLRECLTDGLIDTSLLETTFILKNGDRKNPLSAMDCTDAQFLKWIVDQVNGIDATNRLRFRMLMLWLLPTMKDFKNRHWIGE